MDQTGRKSSYLTLTHLVVDGEILRSLNEKRVAAKRSPYQHIEKSVLAVLEGLRNKGLKIGLISNCSAEEIDGLFSCPLKDFINEIVLSFEVGNLSVPRMQG